MAALAGIWYNVDGITAMKIYHLLYKMFVLVQSLSISWMFCFVCYKHQYILFWYVYSNKDIDIYSQKSGKSKLQHISYSFKIVPLS